MADLSPQAQAVLDAVVSHPSINTRARAAAALRAAADECQGLPDGRDCTELLVAIAAELEGAQ